MSAPSGLVVAATFSATPLRASLEAAVAPLPVSFALYGAMPQHLLAATPAAGQTLVLARVEDWLRATDASEPPEVVRERLRRHVDELVEQLQTSASRAPTLFLCCPSRGSVATKRKLVPVCQTYTSLLVSAAGSRSGATVLRWDELDLPEESFDASADRMGQIPFTQPCFDALGRALGAALLRLDTAPASAAPPTSNAIGRFYASLDLRVSFTPATVDDAIELESLARAGTEFRLHPDPRSADALRTLVEGADTTVWRIAARDRFGDYPKAGFVELTEAPHFRVRQLVLTCPVLGKQVEHAVLLTLARHAQNRGAARISLRCESGPACELAHAFFSSVGVAIDRGFEMPVTGLEATVLEKSLAPEAIVSSIDPGRRSERT